MCSSDLFLIAGDRFAIGSSREMSPAGLKGVAEEAGLQLVVVCGNNMGDIFRRNALNLGLQVVQSPEAVADARDGDEFSFEPASRRLTNETQGKTYDPVPLSAKEDEISFSPAVRRLPIRNADPYLNDLLVRFCEDARARRAAAPSSLRTELENALAPRLPHGEVRSPDVARQLGMSERTLARRLGAEKTSFATVLMQLRKDLANRYLEDRSLSVSQIAWLLGYRDVSAFTHAFKRWTGTNPRRARGNGRVG